MEHLLSALLDALADPTVSYIGLGYDATVGISAGNFIFFFKYDIHVQCICAVGDHRHIMHINFVLHFYSHLQF